MLVFHYKTESAASDTAAEAMKGLPLRADVKRRRFLLMKWAKRLEIRSRSLERKIGPDDLHDIVGCGDLLDGLGWDHVFYSFAFGSNVKVTQRGTASKL